MGSTGKKNFLKLISILVFILGLVGCSSDAKSESEIKKDMKNQFLDSYTLSFDDIDVDITKRQTNKDRKTDYVWGTVVAENDIVRVTCDYSMEYILYNDGWQLEGCWTDNSDYEVLRSDITEEDALNAIKEKYPDVYEDIQFSDRDSSSLDRGYETFKFIGQHKKDKYMVQYDIIEVTYAYSLSRGWELKRVDDSDWKEAFDVEGTWTYVGDDAHVEIIIHEITEEQVYLEYSYKYSLEMWKDGIVDQKTHEVTVREPIVYSDEIWLELRRNEFVQISKQGVEFFNDYYRAIRYKLEYQGKVENELSDSEMENVQEQYDEDIRISVSWGETVEDWDIAAFHNLEEFAADRGYDVEIGSNNGELKYQIMTLEGYLNYQNKPDIVFLHPLDDSAFSDIIDKLKEAGIVVIGLNTDAYDNTDKNVFIDLNSTTYDDWKKIIDDIL